MNTPKNFARIVRFGVFELDLQARELRKRGLRLRLEEKPLQILELLLEKPGELVTRNLLREKLWPDTFVNFDYSLNTAVNKLRRALGDSANSPRFVETMARRGYRFIGSVEVPSSPVPSSATIQPGVSSIAALPFQNASGEPEMEYLSDGVTEAIIRSLSRMLDLRVLAWSTVLRYKGKELDPQTIGQDLRVHALLVGKVLQRGDDLTMSAELVDASTGRRLWGEKYERRQNEILQLQEEIVTEISEKLRSRLAEEEKKRLAKRYTSNLDAYSDYLKGRYHWHQLHGDALKKSVLYFQQAIEKDPSFALAYSALADAYILFAFVGVLPPKEAIPLARRAALSALAIDDELAEAHASLASIRKSYDWDWPAAEREYKLCLKLNPNNAIARRGYADFLSALGRANEAMVEIRHAQELDPLSLVISVEVAWGLYMAREYARSMEESLKTLEMEPEFPAAYHGLGLALEQMGKYGEAIEAFEKARDRSGAHASTLAGLGHAYALQGRRDEAKKILQQLNESSSKTYISPCTLAIVHAGLGEKDEAMEWLERAFEAHDVWLVWLKTEPRFDVLRPDSRFQDLQRRVKFPD